MEDNDNRNAWWFAYTSHHLNVADALLDLSVRAPDSYYTLCQLREKFYYVDYCIDDADVLLRIANLCLDYPTWLIGDTISLLKRCKDQKLTHLGDDLSNFFHKRYDRSSASTNQLSWYTLRIVTSISTVAKLTLSLNLPAFRQFINLKDTHGLTLLDYAIKESNFSNVALFLELGADIDSLIGYFRLESLKYGADISNLTSHFRAWSKTMPEQTNLVLLSIFYSNLDTCFKHDNSLVHLAISCDLPALIPLCKAANMSLNQMNQFQGTPIDASVGYRAIGGLPDPEGTIQLLAHGVCPTANHQQTLQNSKVNLYYCLLKRLELLEKSNRQGLSNQATQAADIATLTTAFIDTREQHQHHEKEIPLLKKEVSLLETKCSVLKAMVDKLNLKSPLKQIESESRLEKLEEQLEKLLKEQLE